MLVSNCTLLRITETKSLCLGSKWYSFAGEMMLDGWMFLPGRQLTIFNTQASISIGGSDRSRPFQGQLSGLYYNGLRVLHMAVESNQNIKVNGSVRLVGDVPSVVGAARSTGMPPEMSATLIETTTMMSTTTTRKHRSSSTVQVCTYLPNRETHIQHYTKELVVDAWTCEVSR